MSETYEHPSKDILNRLLASRREDARTQFHKELERDTQLHYHNAPPAFAAKWPALLDRIFDAAFDRYHPAQPLSHSEYLTRTEAIRDGLTDVGLSNTAIDGEMSPAAKEVALIASHAIQVVNDVHATDTQRGKLHRAQQTDENGYLRNPNGRFAERVHAGDIPSRIEDLLIQGQQAAQDYKTLHSKYRGLQKLFANELDNNFWRNSSSLSRLVMFSNHKLGAPVAIVAEATRFALAEEYPDLPLPIIPPNAQRKHDPRHVMAKIQEFNLYPSAVKHALHETMVDVVRETLLQMLKEYPDVSVLNRPDCMEDFQFEFVQRMKTTALSLHEIAKDKLPSVDLPRFQSALISIITCGQEAMRSYASDFTRTRGNSGSPRTGDHSR